MVRKSFRLDHKARFYECEGVGFTHITARCADCGQECLKPISDLGWKRRMMTIGDYAGRDLRCACGGRIDPASVWVWAENMRYRGPR